METRLSNEQFNEIFEYAESFIQPGEANEWIGKSNLIRRAYYWRLINGLESLSSKEDVERMMRNMLIETALSGSELDQIIEKALLRK
jgi:hypothetical protein